MDFYDKLLLKKADKKLGYRELGKIIGMKEQAIHKAVHRKSLSELQKRELSEVLGLEKENQDINNNINTTKKSSSLSDEELITELKLRQQRLSKNPLYKLYIENEILKMLLSIEKVKNKKNNLVALLSEYFK